MRSLSIVTAVSPTMTLVDVANLVVAAILLAGIYAVMSVGMTVIYGVMKIVNLAHAGFMMLGDYFALELFERLHLDPILAAILVFPIMMIVGVLVYFIFVRWLPRSDTPTLPSLLLMFGLWLVLQNFGYVIWGNTDRSIFTPRTFDVIHLGPLVFPTIRVYVFVAGVGCVLLLEALLNWTWMGRSIRALVQNPYAGRIVGVDDHKLAAITFGLGIGFCRPRRRPSRQPVLLSARLWPAFLPDPRLRHHRSRRTRVGLWRRHRRPGPCTG